MNTEELARRAVACPGWRWMPGMRDMGGNIYLGQYANHHDRHGWCGFDRGQWIWGVDDFGLPDLTDPATLGCLTYLVRSAWAKRMILGVCVETCPESSAWWTTVPELYGQAFGTEASALVSALEAVP